MKQLIKRLGLLLMCLLLLLSGCKSEVGQENRDVDVADKTTTQSQLDIAAQPAGSDEDLLSQWEIDRQNS